MATEKQVTLALHLLREKGYGTRYMGSEHKRFARMNERRGTVEEWLKSKNNADLSALIDELSKDGANESEASPTPTPAPSTKASITKPDLIWKRIRHGRSTPYHNETPTTWQELAAVAIVEDMIARGVPFSDAFDGVRDRATRSNIVTTIVGIIEASRPRLVSGAMGAVETGRRSLAFHWHAVEINDTEVLRVLCNSAKPKHILGDWSMFNTEPVSCPKCKRKLKALEALGIKLQTTEATQ
jgi:hypothetical protein